jgi:type IV pilus assembly protein PilX
MQRNKHSQGFSLIVTMILLVIVSLLGIAASQMTLLTEKVTRFDRDQQIAFQAAEAALLDAEFDIRGPNAAAANRETSFTSKDVLGFADGCGTLTDQGKCTPSADVSKPVWYAVDFTDTAANAKTVAYGTFTGRTFSFGSTGARSEIAPRYIIEAIVDPNPGAGLNNILYRVTAMGFGPRKETQSVVQMIFRKE